MSSARYDGISEWYDSTYSEISEEAEYLAEALGEGQGEACLDVACGTGRYGTAIALETGALSTI